MRHAYFVPATDSGLNLHAAAHQQQSDIKADILSVTVRIAKGTLGLSQLGKPRSLQPNSRDCLLTKYGLLAWFAKDWAVHNELWQDNIH